MIFKIKFLSACLSILVKAPKSPGEISCSNENQQENTFKLEELYDVGVLRSLNYMSTLDETHVHFGKSDIQLLTTDCDLDKDCLNQKKASVKKYQQKMQAIQCIHGLFVVRVLDELQDIIERSSDITELKENLKHPVLIHQYFLKKMLCLLNMAQCDVYGWQIEVFAFVEGLAASNADLSFYKTYFMDNKIRMREKPLFFVDKCVREKYLISRGEDTTSEASTINSLVEDVYLPMVSMYESCELHTQEAYTVKNLMLHHLYPKHDFIFEWGMYRRQVDTEKIERQCRGYGMSNISQQWCLERALDPVGNNYYNILISKGIHLRIVYFVLLHLHVYSTLKNREIEVDEQMHQAWNKPVKCLKKILRLLRFKGNMHWSAVHIMMDDLNNISKEKLAAQEEYTRKYFCQALEDLGLADTSDINQQLIDSKVPEEPKDMYDDIDCNSYALMIFIMKLEYSLQPIDGTFVRFIVSAEGNETFYMH